MSEIEELQSRIMAALDRVAQGVDSLGAGDSDALQQALEEEQEANAQLNERVRELGERQDRALEALEAQAQQATARMEALDLELQRLRRANSQLSDACDALRQANTEGVGEPHLINKAMLAELEALRAMRQAERAEADEIIAALTPLLAGGASAAAGEAI